MSNARLKSAPSVDSNGTVIVAGSNGKLYALDGSSGEMLWSYTVSSWGSTYVPPGDTIIGSDSIIYFGGGGMDDTVYALDRSGNKRWTYSTGGGGVKDAPAIGTNGVVVVNSQDGNVYGLDAARGFLRWSTALGNTAGCSPTMGNDGVVFIGGGGASSNVGFLYAIGPTGSMLWNATVGGAIHSAPAIGLGMVYVGCDDGKVYAFNATTGKRRWVGNGNRGPFYASPALELDGTVYLGTQGGLSATSTFFAINGSTGSRRWSKTTSAMAFGSAAIGTSGAVYVLTSNGGVYSLDAATGSVLWSRSTSAGSDRTPCVSLALGADETVFVGSNTDDFFALKAPSPSASPRPSSSPSASSTNGAAIGVVVGVALAAAALIAGGLVLYFFVIKPRCSSRHGTSAFVKRQPGDVTAELLLTRVQQLHDSEVVAFEEGGK